MNILNRFVDFLKQYRIVGISVAFIVGMAGLELIQSLVNDIILPIIRPFISGEARWEDIIIPIGAVNLRIGSFLSSSINFILIVLLLYIFVDVILRWKPSESK